MRILWVTNQATPELGKELGLKIGFGGGWMTWLSRQVAAKHSLLMVFPIPECYKGQLRGNSNKVTGIGIPIKKGTETPCEQTTEIIAEIISEYKPDVIHIWGTEYLHSYQAIKACEKLSKLDHTIVSIQGLVSIYAKHFWAYAKSCSEYESFLQSITTRNSLHRQYHSYIARGEYEKRTLREAKNVIGRTDWDKACAKLYNPGIHYFHCNETLREAFYNDVWDYEKCEKHSLFVSQGQYPIKGLHLALEAVGIIKNRYSDVKLYVTGSDCIKRRKNMTSYELYIHNKIIEYGLQKNVVFTGYLDERKMKERFINSNVFISASSIENSPNSLGEAMLLGVPVVTSDVGGVKNMINHGVEGYVYPADEPYMLAHYVMEIFASESKTIEMSQEARKHAMNTHDPDKNYMTLMNIYEAII